MTKFEYCLQHVKLAAEKEPERGKFPFKQVAKIIGGGLAGYGLGHVLGHVAGEGAGRVMGNKYEVARKVAPVAGSLLGVAYPMWKAKEQKEIADAIQSARNPSK